MKNRFCSTRRFGPTRVIICAYYLLFIFILVGCSNTPSREEAAEMIKNRYYKNVPYEFVEILIGDEIINRKTVIFLGTPSSINSYGQDTEYQTGLTYKKRLIVLIKNRT